MPMSTGKAPMVAMLMWIPAIPISPKVRMRPVATTATGRRRYLTWEKRRPTARIMRSIAAPMRTPIEAPISCFICWAKAGSPLTVTWTPGGGLEIATTEAMEVSTFSRTSEETPGSRVTIPMVIIFDGT